MIAIYTDGACNKKGEGGFGIVITQNNKIIFYDSKHFTETTNNRMELLALIEALKIVTNSSHDNEQHQKLYNDFIKDDDFIIYSDSIYCVNAFNDWMHTWCGNGWINSKKEEVKNVDLMKQLPYFYHKNFQPPQVEWVKGHNNIWQNELADALSNKNDKKIKKIMDCYLEGHYENCNLCQ